MVEKHMRRKKPEDDKITQLTDALDKVIVKKAQDIPPEPPVPVSTIVW